MGNKDRERFEQTGKVFRDGKLVSANKAISDSNQIHILAESLHTGRLSPSKLRKALEANTPKEMRKGADKLTKHGKPLTVKALLEEYRHDKEFQELASEVGLDEKWFIDLAEAEIRRRM